MVLSGATMAISVIITKLGKALPLFITLTRLKYPSILPDIGDKLKVNYFSQEKIPNARKQIR